MSFRNQRGNRLADYRCPCGAAAGSLAAAVWSPEKQCYVKREAKRQKSMGPIVACVLCGRRGRQDGPNFPKDRNGLVLSDYTKARHGIDSVPTDQPCCWFHWSGERKLECETA